MIFQEKIYPILLNDQISLSSCLYILMYSFVIVCYPVCNINFEIYCRFFIEVFFLPDQKLWTKTYNLKNEKSFCD